MYTFRNNHYEDYDLSKNVSICFTKDELRSIIQEFGLTVCLPEYELADLLHSHSITVTHEGTLSHSMVHIINSWDTQSSQPTRVYIDLPQLAQRKYLLLSSLVALGYGVGYGEKRVYKYSDSNLPLTGLPIVDIPGLESLSTPDIVTMDEYVSDEFQFFPNLLLSGQQTWVDRIKVDDGFLLRKARAVVAPSSENDLSPVLNSYEVDEAISTVSNTGERSYYSRDFEGAMQALNLMGSIYSRPGDANFVRRCDALVMRILSLMEKHFEM